MGPPAAEVVDLIVEDGGPTPVGVYRLVHRYGGTEMNAKRAKKLVDAAPQVVLSGLPATQAQALKIEFEAFGATVRLKPSE